MTEVLERHRHQDLVGVTHDAAQGQVHVEELAVGRDQRQTDRRPVEGGAEPLVGFAQRIVGAMVRRRGVRRRGYVAVVPWVAGALPRGAAVRTEGGPSSVERAWSWRGPWPLNDLVRTSTVPTTSARPALRGASASGSSSLSRRAPRPIRDHGG